MTLYSMENNIEDGWIRATEKKLHHGARYGRAWYPDN
jgi:hypothetical protein